MEMKKNVTTHQGKGRGAPRYAPVAAGCLLALLALPGYAWQPAGTQQATLAGEFEGSTPIAWDHQVASAVLPDLKVHDFIQVGNAFQATVKSPANATHVFKIVQQKAQRHQAIHQMKVEYLDKDGNPIAPVWNDTSKKVALTLPGEFTPTGSATPQPLTVSTAFRGGAGVVALWDKGLSNDFAYCLQDSVVSRNGSYADKQFTGLLADVGHVGNLDNGNYRLVINERIFSIDELLQRANTNTTSRTRDFCDNNNKHWMEVSKVHLGAQIGANGTAIPFITAPSGDALLNNTSTSVFFAALSLPANEDVKLTTTAQLRPGNWTAPLTVRLTAI